MSSDLIKRLSFNGEDSFLGGHTSDPMSLDTDSDQDDVLERTVVTLVPAKRPNDPVRVILRIRPPTIPSECTLDKLDECKVRAKAPDASQFAKTERGMANDAVFAFSKVLDHKTPQDVVFDEVARPLVENLIKGRDGLIFAYGVTNSGKTYTVEGGSSPGNRGLIPRILDMVFESDVEAFVSYLQVYNDQVHDLTETMPVPGPMDVVTPQRKNLRVKIRDQVIVDGLKECKITNVKEGLAVLERGRENRKTEDNSINQASSRSHTVWQIRVGNSSLHVVDLAGSERGKRTKASGVRQTEASNINLSLSQLMLCLDAMRYNQKLSRLYPDKPRNKPPFKQIPFRDSKLTLLFRDCLLGKNNSCVVMIVNASPDPMDFDETIQALRYGEATKATTIDSGFQLGGGAAQQAPGILKYDYNGRPIRDGAAAAPIVKFDLPSSPIRHRSSSGNLATSAHVNAIAAYTAMVSIDSPPSKRVVLENDRLKRDLADAQERLLGKEMEIRAELSLEMSERLRMLEERYSSRMDRAKDLGDERTMLTSAKKLQNQNDVACSMEDFRILAEQVDECEQEMQRMQQRHKDEVEALQTQLSNALRDKNAVISANSMQELNRPVKDQSLPWMVAEERKKNDRLMKELEDEKEAHRQILMDKAELEEYVKRAEEERHATAEREAVLLHDMESLKDQLDAVKRRLRNEESAVLALKSKMEKAGFSTDSAKKKRKSEDASCSPIMAQRMTTRGAKKNKDENSVNE